MRERDKLLRIAGEIEARLEELKIIIDDAREKSAEFDDKEPDSFELRGLASLLHDFYTVIEDIFEIIADDLNGGVPDSLDWHKRLLTTMAIRIPNLRPPVLLKETAARLEEYLRFRHVFRNVYGHRLDWARMKPLMANLEATYADFSQEIEAFREFLLKI